MSGMYRCDVGGTWVCIVLCSPWPTSKSASSAASPCTTIAVSMTTTPSSAAASAAPCATIADSMTIVPSSAAAPYGTIVAASTAAPCVCCSSTIICCCSRLRRMLRRLRWASRNKSSADPAAASGFTQLLLLLLLMLCGRGPPRSQTYCWSCTSLSVGGASYGSRTSGGAGRGGVGGVGCPAIFLSRALYGSRVLSTQLILFLIQNGDSNGKLIPNTL